MREPGDQELPGAVRDRQRVAISIMGGYVVACAAAIASFFLIGLMMTSPQSDITMAEIARAIALSFMFLLVAALPGFLILRAGIAWLKRQTGREHLLFFPLAGALNAGATIGVTELSDRLRGAAPSGTGWQGGVVLHLLACGAIAGLACYAAERLTLRRSMVGRPDRGAS